MNATEEMDAKEVIENPQTRREEAIVVYVAELLSNRKYEMGLQESRDECVGDEICELENEIDSAREEVGELKEKIEDLKDKLEEAIK